MLEDFKVRIPGGRLSARGIRTRDFIGKIRGRGIYLKNGTLPLKKIV